MPPVISTSSTGALGAAPIVSSRRLGALHRAGFAATVLTRWRRLRSAPQRVGVYLSPIFCLLALQASANSIRRRIASEREGLSFCCLAQLSISDLSAGGSRRGLIAHLVEVIGAVLKVEGVGDDRDEPREVTR